MRTPVVRLALLSLAALLLAQSGLALARERVALVVGNDHYQHAERLDTARNDARDVAHALERFHFRVTLRLDLDEKGLREAVRNFKAEVQPGDDAVFYFSGHGAQFDAASYLLPVDIHGEDAEQVKDDSLPLQRVLDDLEDRRAGFLLAIIDACRNNPFQPGHARRLASHDATAAIPAAGQLVVFSAAAGQEALDRLDDDDRDPHGVFTRVLLKQMEHPEVPVDRMMRQVRAEVVRLARGAGHEQVPAVFDQTIGDFYLQPPVTEAEAPVPDSSEDIDEDAWHSALQAGSDDALRAYLEVFPRGLHAGTARWRLALHRIAPQPAANTAAADSAPARVTLARPVAGRAPPRLALAKPVPSGPSSKVALSRVVPTRTPAKAHAPAHAHPDPRESGLIKAVAEISGRPGRRASGLLPVKLRLPAPAFAPAAPSGAHNGALAGLQRTLAHLPHAPSASAVRNDPGFADCASCPRMLIIPAGRFGMGSAAAAAHAEELPLHPVVIPEPYAMSQHPVTQGQWRALMGSNPSYFDTCGDNCPVEEVSWDEVQEFIARLNAATGRHYRLPSEAEWEFACRGGATQRYCGSDRMADVAWTAYDSGESTHPVGRKRANGYGLDDMSGNVEQWLADCYHPDYRGAPGDGRAWTEQSCSRHVVRGSAWPLDGDAGRTTRRSSLPGAARSSMVGFRLVRALD